MPTQLEEVTFIPSMKDTQLISSSWWNSSTMAIPKSDKLVFIYYPHTIPMPAANGTIAAENLVGFSTAQPDLFKRHQLLPIRDLKLLVRDYTVRDNWSWGERERERTKLILSRPLRRMH
jgi:hypothetical protein